MIQKIDQEKEQIYEILVEDWELQKVENDQEIVFFTILVKRGRQGTFVSFTKRRYSEFRNFYQDMKQTYKSSLNFPEFPGKGIGQSHNTNQELCMKRCQAFNALFAFIAREKLHHDQHLQEFIKSEKEVPYYGKKSKA